MAFKSGYYSIVRPLQCGAALSTSATLAHMEKLENFGKHLGIAFQIQDDLLGITGDPEKTGKSIESDILEHKITLPLLIACEDSQKNKERIAACYQQTELSPTDIQEMRDILCQQTVITRARDIASEHLDAAKQIIPILDISNNDKILLDQLATYLVTRAE